MGDVRLRELGLHHPHRHIHLRDVFHEGIVGSDTVQGTVLWSRAVTISAVLVALLSPFMGALADRTGYRRHFVIATTALTVALFA